MERGKNLAFFILSLCLTGTILPLDIHQIFKRGCFWVQGSLEGQVAHPDTLVMSLGVGGRDNKFPADPRERETVL